MGTLSNISIRMKFLMVVTTMAAMMVAGTGFVYVTMQKMSADYDHFIDEDVTASLSLTGATLYLQNMGYSAYQTLVYDAGTPENTKAMESFRNSIATFEERLKQVPQTDRLDKAKIDGFMKTFQSIRDDFGKAVEAGSQNRNDEAKALLARTDVKLVPLADDMRAMAVAIRESVFKNSNDMKATTESNIFWLAASAGSLTILSLVVSFLFTTYGISRPLNRVTERMRSLAAGDTNTPIDGVERGDEVGTVAKALNVFREAAIENRRLEAEAEMGRSATERDRLAREQEKARADAEVRFAVDALAQGLASLAAGDLTQSIDTPFAEKLEKLRIDFNATTLKLRDTVAGIRDSVVAINAGSREIQAAANDLSKRTEQQAASVEETAAALEEITTTVTDSNDKAQDAGRLVARAKANAEQSGTVVRRAVEAMSEIERSSNEISNIIGVIDEIAFQTNLLALNAGVEAARAGEAGKGFAVVATEVRELAQRSAAAAKEIKALIRQSSEKVELGVSLVGDTGVSLDGIVSEVQEINGLVAQIAGTSREQATGLAEINTAVNLIDQNTQQNAAMVEQSTAASHGLSREAESLSRMIAAFRTGGESTRHEPVREAPVARAANPVQRMTSQLKSSFASQGSAALKHEGWEDF
ncbi:MAG: methyl-accepting chemotaxis protein [Shinella sp.]|nr:MAG: methyl-accepting chemotaxis protein [Shinella sp.]